ncbi:hypothetical protein CMI37_18820 [Candidatus Pacearchaeota archaeon]|nr:hypothetical protein [Candidatus Pacearchaeota archaeon]
MGREENYRNPYGSIPSPAAKEIPKTLWYTQPGMQVAWRGLQNSVDRAFWQTPTFDLRPDLRSAQSMAKAGVPIWDPTARLYIQIFGLTTTPATTENLRLGYRELANTTFGEITQAAPNRAVANPGFPNQTARDPLVYVIPRVDITSELMMGTNQPDSAVLVFEPLGEGYPVRYWRVELSWENLDVAGPAISFQAAVY